MPQKSRKDKKGRVLKTGEIQRKDGIYEYRYSEPVTNIRHSVYASTLKELREKELEVTHELKNGIRFKEGNITVAELLTRHLQLKKNLRKSSLYNYQTKLNMISHFSLSQKMIRQVKPSDCKAFVVQMQEAGYAYGTICGVAGLCKQAFNFALEDDLIIKNPWQFKLNNVIMDGTVKNAV